MDTDIKDAIFEDGIFVLNPFLAGLTHIWVFFQL
jgi:hypothetical protein